MKVVSSGYSYSSCDGIIETLSAMFPGAIPNTFTMNSSNVSLFISEATGPFFHGVVVSGVKVDSGRSVTAEGAALSEASINGLRSTRDGLKLFDKKLHLVPMTREFLSLGRQAHSHYVARLEEDRINK